MPRGACKLFVLFVGAAVFVAGCATTKPRRPDPGAEQQNQIVQMQAQLQAKDHEIQELQSKLEAYEQALQDTSGYSGFAGGSSRTPSVKSSIIRVSGVSVEDVQKALIRAGFDPGPVDGRAGKKTKAAVREFQRRHNLKADGLVGEKTWSRLK